jgi:cytoskeletal protein CcmA (bactofilin family)
MFKGRDQTKPAASNGSGLNSVLGDGSQMSGKVKVDGSIRVDGEFEGQLFATDSVVIGRTGVARADLEAREIVVAGCVEGKLVAQERVELQAGARVTGDVWAHSFVISDGVVFNGSCSMGEMEDGRAPAAGSVGSPSSQAVAAEDEEPLPMAVFKTAGSGRR